MADFQQMFIGDLFLITGTRKKETSYEVSSGTCSNLPLKILINIEVVYSTAFTVFRNERKCKENATYPGKRLKYYQWFMYWSLFNHIMQSISKFQLYLCETNMSYQKIFCYLGSVMQMKQLVIWFSVFFIRNTNVGVTQTLPNEVVDSVILVEGPWMSPFTALTYIAYSVPSCNPSNLYPWRSLGTSYDWFCELISIDSTYFSTLLRRTGISHSVAIKFHDESILRNRKIAGGSEKMKRYKLWCLSF